MAEGMIQIQAAPSLNLPESTSVVDVSIINTSTDIVVHAWSMVEPVQDGHEYLNLPTFAFLIQNKSQGKSVMFDLGCRKDWWNSAPAAINLVIECIPGLRIEKGVDEILQEGGIDLDQLDAVIWSHWHYDHTGDMSKFPQSIPVYVGPGFKAAFMPGFPESRGSYMLASDFTCEHQYYCAWYKVNYGSRGRQVIEIDFGQSERIGQFLAYDFFGDGSFYVLDVPGHAIGHVAALARTTRDTFVFMGGDVCHFGGSYQPSPHSPMPSMIPPTVPLDRRLPSPCPCSIFEQSHFAPASARTMPFYKVTKNPKGFYVDPEVAQSSIDGVVELDANANVLVCLAHDGGLLPIVDWFPHGNINAWKEKGWKEKCKWGFLNELPLNGRPGRPRLVPGLMKDSVPLTEVDKAELKAMAETASM